MGRLTRRSNDEIFLTCGFYSSYYWKQNPFYEAVDKLAHYEDLEEQLMESAEIDIDSMVGEFMHYYNLQKENRLIELPCAVGDTVYDISEFIESCPYAEIYEDEVTYIGISKDEKGLIYELACCDYRAEDFGKIAFFNKEQAEAEVLKISEAKLKELEE